MAASNLVRISYISHRHLLQEEFAQKSPNTLTRLLRNYQTHYMRTYNSSDWRNAAYPNKAGRLLFSEKKREALPEGPGISFLRRCWKPSWNSWLCIHRGHKILQKALNTIVKTSSWREARQRGRVNVLVRLESKRAEKIMGCNNKIKSPSNSVSKWNACNLARNHRRKSGKERKRSLTTAQPQTEVFVRRNGKQYIDQVWVLWLGLYIHPLEITTAERFH